MRKQLTRHRAHGQQGAALIEALVALLVLALGLLGMARLHLGNLTETRQANERSVAIQLAGDLQERLRLNPEAATLGKNPYFMGFDDGPVMPVTDCRLSACGSEDLARFDAWQWRTQVASTLPQGSASVFASPANSGQWGVLLSWTEVQARNQAQADSDAARADYRDAQGVWLSAGTQGTGVEGQNCPPARSCHLVYIRP